jgi:uncharacterized protein
LIGVPAIPAPSHRTRPPLAVPSAEVPADTEALDPVPPGAGPSIVAEAPGVVEGVTRFSEEVAAKLKCYVYLLVDPRTGRAFYAGRGRSNRCFLHLDAARGGPTPSGEAEAFPVLDRIREVESSGRPVRIDILRHGMTGSEADLVEASVNDALGLPLAPGSSGQRCSVAEVGSLLAKRAKFKRVHQVVLLRVGATGADTSYEVARHHWRIGRRWTDLESPRSPRYAVVVAGDMVAGVYRIDGWELSAPTGAGPARTADRFSFIGPPDPEVEERYLGRSVAGYLGHGVTSPVTYVWCGPHWVNDSR